MFIVKLQAYALLVLLCGITAFPAHAQSVDYRHEMRTLVQSIGAYARGRDAAFIVIPQNGQELLTTDGTPAGPAATDYVGAIDGQGREDVFYGYTADNVATPTADRDYFLGFLDRAESLGIQVLSIDYCWTHTFMDNSYAANHARGYISFAADHRGLDNIPAYPPQPYGVNTDSVQMLSDAHNFLYLLDGEPFGSRQAYLNALAATDYDAMVLDLFYEGVALSPAEVAGLRTKPHGGQRLLIAYMSIGEAEDYRYYWQSGWTQGSPEWLLRENPDWEGNFKVRYWDPAWQTILLGGEGSYLDQILDAGFDGVYLDLIDAFEYFEDGNGDGNGGGGCMGGTVTIAPGSSAKWVLFSWVAAGLLTAVLAWRRCSLKVVG